MASTYTVTDEQRRTILRQLGTMNRVSIDGGRSPIPTPNGLQLRCGNGYRVEIGLEPDDTYTVRRWFVRGTKAHLKGEQRYVFCHDLPEVAYRAGMFHDPF